MAPSRVDPNWKQAKSSIDQVEEDPFVFDRMARTVSAKLKGDGVDEECENILHGFLYVFDLAFVILKGLYGFKFSKRFLEISSRDLTLFTLLLN